MHTKFAGSLTKSKGPVSKRRAFTLIEIMVVVIIIGLLAGLVGPQIWKQLGFGQKATAETMCQQLFNNVKFFEATKRIKVTELRELEEPLDEGEDSYITLQDDPWGNAYWLESSGRKRHVCSAGPDGQEGSEDDICYPSKEEA
ncbi:MAG: type II secretion system protein GspG [Planctomycetota bacterium]